MRILLVNYEYPPLGGGGGVLTQTLAAELAGAHEVTVLTSRGPGAATETTEKAVRIVRVPVVGRRDASRASLASMLSFVPAAIRSGRRWGRGSFDVVHTFFAVPTGPAGTSIARRVGVPHVLTVIGADIHDPSRMSPDRFRPLGGVVARIVRGADVVTAISGDIVTRAERLTGRSGIELVSCAVAPADLPAPDRASLGWSKDDVVVVTIGRLVARKGIAALIRAVGSAGSPLRLEVIGDGPQIEELRALASTAAPGRVTFAGALAEPEKLRRLAAADAFALVSQHEGFGLVYLEAMNARLPVLAGSIGGQTDFLRHEENALLVEPGDVRSISNALGRIAGEPTLRSSLAEAGAHTAADFVPERMAARYVETYERALTSRRSR